MKKLLILILTIVCLVFITFALSGCNRQLVDTNRKFEYVHIYETGKCYEIKSWRDYNDSDQIQVTLKDGTVMLLHSTDCALIHGDGCVLCEDKKK